MSADREAVIRLQVTGSSGQVLNIEAILDTGFTGYLTLPSAIIASLGLPWLSQGQATMANGCLETFDIYAGEVMWDGTALRIATEEADTQPLVGMSLIYGYSLAMDAVDGGSIVLERT